MEKLKKKYPHAYNRFKEGTADLEMLRWVMDNHESIKEDKPKYIIVKESRLEEVTKEGVHKYKQDGTGN